MAIRSSGAPREERSSVRRTAENELKENSFIIWRGGEPADFELKVEYRIDATNSGIQIRSVHLPAGTQEGRGTDRAATGS